MKIDGYTRLAAVVARPIKHSQSPFIHNYAFDKTGINGVYLAWDIAEEDLSATIENIKRYDMWGINLSMPYKKQVIPFLDELTKSASLIGAVNTVINRDGKLIGHNTDGIGFFKSLSFLADFDVKGKDMVILGGGGASTAIIAQAALNEVSRIHVFSRKASIERVKDDMTKLSRETKTEITVNLLEDRKCLQQKILDADLLVNGTSVGMDGESLILDKSIDFPNELLVADVIYQPFETPLLTLAKSRGLKAVNGLGMLLFQAAEAFECWTSQKMPVEDIWLELEQKYR